MVTATPGASVLRPLQLPLAHPTRPGYPPPLPAPGPRPGSAPSTRRPHMAVVRPAPCRPSVALLLAALSAAIPVSGARLAAQPFAPVPGAPVAGRATALESRGAPTPAVDPPPVLGARDARVAGAFAAGALVAAALDRPLAVRLQRPAVQESRALGLAARSLRRAAEPGVFVALPLLWAAGRLTDDRPVAAAGLRGMEALAVSLATVGVTKVVAGRARPYVKLEDPTSWQLGRGYRASEYRSFPSGHTAAAFAAASAVTAELGAGRPGTRWAAGVPLYAAAAGVGWARMYENRHWASDVVAGAAVGTVSGLAVARWHRTRPDGAIDRRLLGAAVSIAPGRAPRLLLARVPAPPRDRRRGAAPAAR